MSLIPSEQDPTITPSGQPPDAHPPEKSPNKENKQVQKEISQVQRDAMAGLKQTTETPGKIAADTPEKSLDAKGLALADRLARIAVESKIAPEEVIALLDKGQLSEQLLKDESLADAYEKAVSLALNDYMQRLSAGMGHVNVEDILKIIALAFKAGVMTNKGAIIESGGKQFLTRVKLNKGKIYAIPLASKQELGSGKFSTANRVSSLIHPPSLVFKQAKAENIQKSMEQLLNEHAILKDIHKDGVVEGVKSTPYAVVGITKPRNKGASEAEARIREVGLLEHEYNGGDLINLLELWNDDHYQTGDFHEYERLDLCLQLLKGVQNIHRAGYRHGDIKPDNVLISTDETGIKAFVADFGAAISKKQILENLSKFVQQPEGMLTPEYILFDDYRSEIELGSQANSEAKVDACIELKAKRDVFAIGLTLAFLLTGGREIVGFQEINLGELGTPSFPDLDKRYYEEDIIALYTPSIGRRRAEKLAVYINALVHPDREERFGIDDAVYYFESILRSIQNRGNSP